MTVYILFISVILQLGAAVLALSLIPITKRKAAWFLIAAAILLMTFRRSITLIRLLMGWGDYPADPVAELIALVISVCMITGVYAIRPLFLSMQRTSRELQWSKQTLSFRQEIATSLLTHRGKEMYTDVLNIVLHRFDSKLGFFGYIDSNGDLVCPSMTNEVWEQCEVEGKSFIFPHDEWTGVWGDSLREKKSIIKNRGITIPAGHVSMDRVLVVPVIYKRSCIGLFSIANKPEDYTEEDREMLESVAEYVAPILHERMQRDLVEIQREVAEEELGKSEERLKMIVESTEDIIILHDLGGTCLYYNGSPQYGLTPSDVIGKTVYDIFPPTIAESVQQELMEVVITGKPVKNEQLTPWQGKTIWFLNHRYPVRAKTGGIIGVVSFSRNITERKQAEEELVRSLEEKRLLLREVHHRVKNDLQIISNLIDMSGRRMQEPDTKETLKNVKSKILSMSLMHTQLYNSERFDRINCALFIKQLIAELSSMFTSPEKQFTVEMEMEEVFLPINFAIPFGLVINEILTNAYRHAFPNDMTGTVRILLKKGDNRTVVFSVRDTGTGIDEGFDLENAPSMGMKLIRDITRLQLKGEVSITVEGGTEVYLEFSSPGNVDSYEKVYTNK